MANSISGAAQCSPTATGSGRTAIPDPTEAEVAPRRTVAPVKPGGLLRSTQFPPPQWTRLAGEPVAERSDEDVVVDQHRSDSHVRPEVVHLQPDVRRQLTHSGATARLPTARSPGEAVGAEPALADSCAHRATLWPEAARDWTGGTHHFHESALRDAGFAEAGVVWQDLQTRVIAGLR